MINNKIWQWRPWFPISIFADYPFITVENHTIHCMFVLSWDSWVRNFKSIFSSAHPNTRIDTDNAQEQNDWRDDHFAYHNMKYE